MSAHDPADIALLKKRLLEVESALTRILSGIQEDEHLAALLQKLLMPNRSREIPGLKTHSRYISAQALTCESFDLIPTKDHRELWVVMAWTQSYGLSSVLMQSLVHFQSQALVESRPQISPEELFNALSTSLVEAKRSGRYRLFVAKIDVATLRISGVSIGQVPPLVRVKEKNQFGPWGFLIDDVAGREPLLMESALSALPVLAENAFVFSSTLKPGSRLYLMSSSWNEGTAWKEWLKPLQLETSKATDSDLVEDMNHLLMKAEDHCKAHKKESDLLCICLEVNEKKLHLA